MGDFVRSGEIVLGLFVTLLVVLFVTTRLYIHSIRRCIRGTQKDFQALRSELYSVKRRVHGGEPPLTL